MVIGVYGIIGSGKSTVARIFKDVYGFKIIDADSLGHKILDLPEVREKLIKEFGNIILRENKAEIDKNLLGDIIFTNKEKKETLERIVWKYMSKLIESEIKEGDKVLIDAAVLFLAGWDRFCDYTIYVHTFLPLIFLRLLREKRYPFIKIIHIIQSQKEIMRDGAKATFKIYDNFSLKSINRRIDRIWKRISP